MSSPTIRYPLSAGHTEVTRALAANPPYYLRETEQRCGHPFESLYVWVAGPSRKIQKPRQTSRHIGTFLQVDTVPTDVSPFNWRLWSPCSIKKSASQRDVERVSAKMGTHQRGTNANSKTRKIKTNFPLTSVLTNRSCGTCQRGTLHVFSHVPEIFQHIRVRGTRT